ncbi:membrane fusion protein (multidrug efflux system) [Actimicrobium sp. GrIS 1.19]|uniref:HlyD family secretion protein n=1 Tax=Actimicrobium sp. GrIS 1.19 TaxID=3071708 RepID=UPI002DFB1F35|nr:membrane fusion protein (multidrug efflux system) [Actimicrobium sp. GrIS 1.19]
MNSPVTAPEVPTPVTAPEVPTPVAAPNRKRRTLMLLVTAVLILLLIAYGIWWALFARHFESTDDAYVAGNVVQITSQVAGTVIAINADDTELVQAGKPLVQLDATDARVALDQASAQLAQTVREVRTLFVNNGTLNANVTARNTDLDRARADLARRTELIGSGAVSKEELEHARNALQSAESALSATREQLASNRVLTEHTSVAQHPNVLRAAAQVQVAHLAMVRASLPAPITGYVAKRSVQVGQRIAAGAPLMSLVPLSNLWVDANFKEVQIAHMRIDQPVTLRSDLYGSDVSYHGKVVGLAAGTGAAFALLPTQNASGNWIKVVQRIPVRILLDPSELAAHPLRVGVSMQVKVDIAADGGTSLTSNRAARTAPAYATAAFEAADKDAAALIARIIDENSGAAVKPTH